VTENRAGSVTMIARWLAASPDRVRVPSDGGQSMITSW
jgi:hypothetical protein